MKRLIMFAAALAVCAPAEAAPARSRAAEMLSDNGFKHCAGALDRMVKSAYDEDGSYSFLSVWSPTSPDVSLGSALTMKQFADGGAVQTFSAVKNTSGTCDVMMTAVFPVTDETCPTLRQSSFKDWKRREDLGDAEVYHHPNGSLMSMTPLGLNGCLLVQHTVWYEAQP